MQGALLTAEAPLQFPIEFHLDPTTQSAHAQELVLRSLCCLDQGGLRWPALSANASLLSQGARPSVVPAERLSLS